MHNLDRLQLMTAQSYPLSVDETDAQTLVECISAIMDEVPKDNQVLVRGHYALATSALHHPNQSIREDHP